MGRMKSFKTIDEQIDILRDKGLTISNDDKTKDILLRENYFFINGYRHLLFKGPKENIFIDGSSFDELYALFCFDRNIRNVMFKYLLIVENNLKSIFSYHLSSKYGYKEKEYLKMSNFVTDISKRRQVADVINKMKRQIKTNAKQHTATLHYLTNYGYIPMWILVKVLSFGLISELFMILKPEDQKEIAKYYKMDAFDMTVFLPIMSNYRNLCAHEDILYNHETQKSIVDTRYHELLEIPQVDGEYIYGKHDIFALIIILKQMLTHTDFKMMMNEIEYEIEWLSSKLHSIDVQKVLYRMGFPDNYKQISYME